MQSSMPRVLGLALLLATGLALALAPGALAATLSVGTDGTLTYAAAAGTVSEVSFVQGTGSKANTVTVIRYTGPDGADTDPIVPGPGCTQTASDADSTTYDCAAVGRVVADGGDLGDTLYAAKLTTITANLRGGPGDDFLDGGEANDVLSGGDGDDELIGNGGNDLLTGDAGDDLLVGGEADDVLSGGDGGDELNGNGGNDLLTGDAGDDFLDGGSGRDGVDGGAGDDFLLNQNERPAPNAPSGSTPPPSDAGDVLNGGDGFDTLGTEAFYRDSTGEPVPVAVSVTLDGVANDGAPGENDNVSADVERVSADGVGSDDTLVGSDGVNTLSGNTGKDTLDGGRGNDQLFGGPGDDVINAQDGFADYVSCGSGNDTANVDTLDTVSSDCETVNRRDVGNANDVPEDRAPTVGIVAPAAGSALSNGANTVTMTAADDKGVARVVLFANGVPVCSLTAAPYTCTFQATGADVGRTALVAVATDTVGQTATDFRSLTLGRFDSPRLSVATTPRRDRRPPFRFTTRGRLALPTGVSAAQGCTGTVSIQVKAGAKTVSTRRVKIAPSCTYRSRVTFAVPRRLRPRGLRIRATFAGNAVIAREQSRRVKTRVK